MKRVRTGVVLAVVGLLVGACGSTLNPEAATVNGNVIERESFEETIDQLADAPDIVAQLAGAEATGDSDGTVPSAAVARTLSFAIFRSLFETENRRLGVEVSEQARTEALEQFRTQFQTPAEFEALPDRIVDDLIASQAAQQALTERLSSDRELRQSFFDDNRELFPEEVCASHILVATEEEAQTILTELEGDGDFGAIARERSTDTGSGAQDGELPCQAPSTFVPEFAAAITTAPIGEVTGPVQTEFGFHVIRVNDRRTPTADQLGDTLGQQYLTLLVENAEIEVDPRYGSWDAATATVVPPEGPQPPRTTGATPPPPPTPVAQG